jgi:hypothetical protein
MRNDRHDPVCRFNFWSKSPIEVNFPSTVFSFWDITKMPVLHSNSSNVLISYQKKLKFRLGCRRRMRVKICIISFLIWLFIMQRQQKICFFNHGGKWSFAENSRFLKYLMGKMCYEVQIINLYSIFFLLISVTLGSSKSLRRY